jgi:hypothetical protein
MCLMSLIDKYVVAESNDRVGRKLPFCALIKEVNTGYVARK